MEVYISATHMLLGYLPRSEIVEHRIQWDSSFKKKFHNIFPKLFCGSKLTEATYKSLLHLYSLHLLVLSNSYFSNPLVVKWPHLSHDLCFPHYILSHMLIGHMCFPWHGMPIYGMIL